MEPYDCRSVARPAKQSVDAHNLYYCIRNAEALLGFISSLPELGWDKSASRCYYQWAVAMLNY